MFQMLSRKLRGELASIGMINNPISYIRQKVIMPASVFVYAYAHICTQALTMQFDHVLIVWCVILTRAWYRSLCFRTHSAYYSRPEKKGFKEKKMHSIIPNFYYYIC